MDKFILPGLAVKITIYTGCLAEDVIYYQYNMPLLLVERWKWYFEYLAALVKIKHPHRKVELYIGPQECLCGTDYISKRAKDLLRSKRIQLKKAQMGAIEIIQEDLFGYAKQEAEEKGKTLLAEIEALERGEYDRYVPPTYINKIKQYIHS